MIYTFYNLYKNKSRMLITNFERAITRIPNANSLLL